MGCDIHLHIEIKVKGNNEWQHYNHPNGIYAGSNSRRNYTLFAKMADVRNEDKEIEPICYPKGLPEDITLVTKLDHERDNFHHESWLNLEEIEKLEDWWNQQQWYKRGDASTYFEEYFGYLFGNGFCEHTLKINNLQDVRFVFWFDN